MSDDQQACQRCKSKRIACVSGKVSDRCGWQDPDNDYTGYVPDGLNVGDGDYIEVFYCLKCGQIQGTWPISKRAITSALQEATA